MSKSRSSYSRQLELERKAIVQALGQLIERLRRIEAALGRLQDGKYGKCTACGKPISAERLDVLPEAELCLSCQERFERSPS